MKKIFTLFGAFCIGVLANAQEAPRTVGNEEIIFSNTRTSPSVVSGNRGGSQFFCEDFSNGFNGNNPIGAWTTGGQNADVWGLADANSPAGFYSSNLASMASPTANNGWIIFDADLAQDGAITASNPVEVMSGWVQAPEMNMSELENVKVEFNQYFRYCCQQLSPLSVEVSVDGGDTWTVFNATGILVTSANQLSANPLLTVIDISCVAANQPSVLIRWFYNRAQNSAYSHYFWGLDDICVYETVEENDLEITQVTNGNIVTVWEYTVTPLEQAITEANNGMVAGVIYRNNGRQDQTNCQITIEVLDGATNEVLNTTLVDPFDMPAPANEEICPAPVLDTVFVSTGFYPPSIGTYIVRASITSDQTDEIPDNNIRERTIYYTTNEYGHNDEVLTTGELRGQADPDNPDLFLQYGAANIFQFPNDGSIVYGLTVDFGANTAENASVIAAMYSDQSTTQAQNFALEGFNYYTTTATSGSDGPIYIAFEEPVNALTDQVYLVSVETEDILAEEVTVLAQPNSDTDNSTARKSLNSTGTYIWFFRNNYSPAIRAILSDGVNVTELNNQNIHFAMMPNPTTDKVRVQFSSDASQNVAYEIRDINGKLVKVSNIGNQPQGQVTFEVDVRDLSAGTYMMNIIAGSQMVGSDQLIIK